MLPDRDEAKLPDGREKGPAPINAERHGVWRILLNSVLLAVGAMAIVAAGIAVAS